MDGKTIAPGVKINKAEAEKLLHQGFVSYEQALNNVIRVTVTQAQFDEMLSLAWNIGIGAFFTSTLLTLLNKQDYAGAASQFLVCKRAGGRGVSGLLRHRNAEQQLFLSD